MHTSFARNVVGAATIQDLVLWTLLAIGFIVAGTVLWLYVLYRMDLSRAYPFLGLGTVFVVALSRIWLREPVSAMRWIGVVIIVMFRLAAAGKPLHYAFADKAAAVDGG